MQNNEPPDYGSDRTTKRLIYGVVGAIVLSIPLIGLVGNYLDRDKNKSPARQPVPIVETIQPQRTYDIPKRSVKPRYFKSEEIDPNSSEFLALDKSFSDRRLIYAARIDMNRDGSKDVLCVTRHGDSSISSDVLSFYVSDKGEGLPDMKVQTFLRYNPGYFEKSIQLGSDAFRHFQFTDLENDGLPDIIQEIDVSTIEPGERIKKLVHNSPWKEVTGFGGESILADLNSNDWVERYVFVNSVTNVRNGTKYPPALVISEWDPAKGYFTYLVQPHAPPYTSAQEVLSQGLGPMHALIEDLKIIEAAPDNQKSDLYKQLSDKYPPDVLALYGKTVAAIHEYHNGQNPAVNEAVRRIEIASASAGNVDKLYTEIEGILQTVSPEYRDIIALRSLGIINPAELEKLKAYQAAQFEFSKPWPLFILSAIDRGYRQVMAENQVKQHEHDLRQQPYISSPAWGVVNENPAYDPHTVREHQQQTQPQQQLEPLQDKINRDINAGRRAVGGPIDAGKQTIGNIIQGLQNPKPPEKKQQ